ncbi:MAG: hypothetical protein K1X72_25145 [Pyrinomonadaceae bacterium]|nr:hypothetical protein [Pyrinomonadaceae bacterium]
MKKLFILICLSFIISHPIRSQNLPELNKIREIKLLEHTNDDIRKILNEYKLIVWEKVTHRDTFETDNSVIEVNYSKGKSDPESGVSMGCEIPEWKATSITITLKKTINPKAIKLDFSNYRKEKVYYKFSDVHIFHNLNEGIGYRVNLAGLTEITYIPPKSKILLWCDQNLVKKVYSRKSWFLTPLKERIPVIDEFPAADVENLILSLSEIMASCSSPDSVQNRSCSEGVKIITVFTSVANPLNDPLTYTYNVTGGKILPYDDKPIELSEKVLWDLSDVKPGTYTITAATDNGCGICGKTKTKSVIVKECSKCN